MRSGQRNAFASVATRRRKKSTNGTFTATSAMYRRISRLLEQRGQTPATSTQRTRYFFLFPIQFVPLYSRFSIRTEALPGAAPQRGQAGFIGPGGRGASAGAVAGTLGRGVG